MNLSRFDHLLGMEVNFHNGIDYTVFSIVDFDDEDRSVGIFGAILYATLKEPETEDVIPVAITDLGVVFLMSDDGDIEFDKEYNGVGVFVTDFGIPYRGPDDVDY